MKTIESPIIVGVTGASGSIYAARLIGRFAEAGKHIHVIFSENGLKVFRHELGFEFNPETLEKYLASTMSGKVGLENMTVFGNDDLFAPPASGTSPYETMVIVPCSMNTLSSVASGRASNLIERSADVFLKERRRLILVPRETPLSTIHIENMLRVSNAGGIVLPAAPAFYFKPESIEDIADFVVSKIFNIIGISSGFIKRWSDETGKDS